MKYIAMLRGINVGGKRKIIMKELRYYLTELGFKDVITYIQSGNIIFSHRDTKNHNLEKTIKNMIINKYGFEVSVIVRKYQELKKIIELNPYEIDEKKLCVIFLNKIPTKEDLNDISKVSFPPDKFNICEDNVFIFCENSFHKTKLTNNFFEKKLNLTATTRNWKTIRKLLELSSPK